jgi:hypothetical protein
MRLRDGCADAYAHQAGCVRGSNAGCRVLDRHHSIGFCSQPLDREPIDVGSWLGPGDLVGRRDGGEHWTEPQRVDDYIDLGQR